MSAHRVLNDIEANGGDVDFGGDVSIAGDLAVSGDITILDDLTITDDLTVGGVLAVSEVEDAVNGRTNMPFFKIGDAEAKSGTTMSPTAEKYYTTITTTGAATGGLADGSMVGQIKKIQMIVDAGDYVLTPSHLSDYTTITFADAGDFVVLAWSGVAWQIIEKGNAADGVSSPATA